jgi:hypothetical protein
VGGKSQQRGKQAFFSSFSSRAALSSFPLCSFDFYFSVSLSDLLVFMYV